MAKAAYPLQLAIAGLAYFAAGWLSLNTFALINSSASPVWPSTGIAIAAFMLGGYRLWPAFLIGAFFIQFYGEWSCAVKRCYSCWKYARARAGSWLANRFCRARAAFNHASSTLAFGALLAIVAAISATIGISALLWFD
jgi:integral membrane sensor domain MASE1